MKKVVPFVRPQPESLSRQQAQELIRDLAKQGKVVFRQHALDRSNDHGVTMPEAMKCLEMGIVQSDPYLDARQDWRAEVTRVGAGRRIKLAVAFNWSKRLVIITVIG